MEGNFQISVKSKSNESNLIPNTSNKKTINKFTKNQDRLKAVKTSNCTQIKNSKQLKKKGSEFVKSIKHFKSLKNLSSNFSDNSELGTPISPSDHLMKFVELTGIKMEEKKELKRNIQCIPKTCLSFSGNQKIDKQILDYTLLKEKIESKRKQNMLKNNNKNDKIISSKYLTNSISVKNFPNTVSPNSGIKNGFKGIRELNSKFNMKKQEKEIKIKKNALIPKL